MTWILGVSSSHYRSTEFDNLKFFFSFFSWISLSTNFSGVELTGQRTWTFGGSSSLEANGLSNGPCCSLPWTLSVFHALLGDGGDQPHPADPGVHVHVSRNNQREREGGAEDVLREHGNVWVPVPEQPGCLKSRRVGGKTVSSGRYNALSDCNFCPSFLDVRALSCPLEPLQTHSRDPVAFRLVCDVCQDRSATCTVLTPPR